MELSSALEDDLTQSMEMCESECRRPIDFVLDRFRTLSGEEGIPKEEHRHVVAKTYVQQYLNAVQSHNAATTNYPAEPSPTHGINHPSIYEHNSLYQNHLKTTLRDTEYFYHDSQMEMGDDQDQNAAAYPIERIMKSNQTNFYNNNEPVVEAQASVMSDLSDSYIDQNDHASIVSTNQFDGDDQANIHKVMNKSHSNPNSPPGRANSSKSSPLHPRVRHIKYPDPAPPLNMPPASPTMPMHHASPEALQMLSAFLEPFDNIKQSLSFSKTKKVSNSVRSDILRYIDHISPYIRGEWDALEDLTVEFAAFHNEEVPAAEDEKDNTFKDSASYLRAKNIMDRTKLENLLLAKFTLKDIQYNCAASSKDAISTVSSFKC